MIQRALLCAAILAAVLLLYGCPAPQETVMTEQPPAPAPTTVKRPAGPDLTLVVASINLGTVNRRIEKADIDELCRTIAREKVDILAVEGMTRYPGVATRIDVYQEIASGTGMRSIFGETNTVSGRQGGNALYSTYPINSHENMPYAGIASSNFESALLGVIDAGARDIAVVSTQLPLLHSLEERYACESVYTSVMRSHSRTPVIITGNLPPPTPPGGEVYHVEQAQGFDGLLTWYAHPGIRAIRTRTVESGLGQILVTEFGVYREGRP